MKVDNESALKELARQVEGFLATAKEQAKAKLQKTTILQLEDFQREIASEKDKALKSLEAYFASDPIPIIENVIQVRLNDGLYEARTSCECEGGIKYDFRLAAQNSRLFHQPFAFSQLGYDLRVPVRFSKGPLSKTRTPGYERLDQYVLADAETSGGRMRANFVKSGNWAKMKLVTSGDQAGGFIGLEYGDRIQAVNIMNDPSLVAFVDMEALKRATEELVSEMTHMSDRKVALLRLSFNGEKSLEDINCRELLQKVMGIMGPGYRALIKKTVTGVPLGDGEKLDVDFVQGRLKVLGDELSQSISQALGFTVTQVEQG